MLDRLPGQPSDSSRSKDEFDILHINIEDVAVTQQLVAAGQHLDIELVDHLVIGNQRFVSLKERLRW